MIKIEVTPRAVKQIRSGSLWIFANEFVTKMKDIKGGDWVNFESRGEFVGYGYVNPHSLIAGRVCSLKPVTERKALIKKLISESVERRSLLRECGSFRAVFSESDSLPGLIVDVYEKNVVAQFNTLGIDMAKDDIVQSLIEVLNPDGLVIKADSSIRELEGAKSFIEVINGSETSLRNGVVREDDVLFAADFVSGQKTGFFLDQRDNRRHLRKICEGKTVLDLCSYSGGWGLSALKSGAKHVTFVDQAKVALDLAKKGMELNKFDPSKAEFICEDVFDYLLKSNISFDIVICDPPAFVKSKKNLPQAIKAYKKLNILAIKKVKPGGYLYSCSCSFHLSENEFESILREAMQESDRLGRVTFRGTQSLDHPWVINRPESRYLKCYGLNT